MFFLPVSYNVLFCIFGTGILISDLKTNDSPNAPVNKASDQLGPGPDSVKSQDQSMGNIPQNIIAQVCRHHWKSSNDADHFPDAF